MVHIAISVPEGTHLHPSENESLMPCSRTQQRNATMSQSWDITEEITATLFGYYNRDSFGLYGVTKKASTSLSS